MKKNTWIYATSISGALDRSKNDAASRDSKTIHHLDRRPPTGQERRERQKLRLERNLLQLLRRGLPSLVLIVIFVGCATPMLAAGVTPIETMVNNIEQLLIGPVGRALAVIGVVIAGFAMMIGENPRVLVTVCLGISLILGGVQLVAWLTS